MVENTVDILETAKIESEKGNISKACSLYRKALKQSEDESGLVLFEFGLFLFFHGFYEEALKLLVKCHQINYKKEEVQLFIMEAYYDPNIEEFKSKYEKNVEKLSEYEHIFRKSYPDFNDLSYRFIPFSEFKFAIFDIRINEFIHEIDLEKINYSIDKYNHQDIIIIKNEINRYNILQCLKKTIEPEPLLWAKLPLYLYYSDFNEFVQFLQINDFEELLNYKRLVFLFDESETYEWFSFPQSIIPSHILNINSEQDELYILINEVYESREKDYTYLTEKVSNYYSLNKNRVIDNIKSGKPRILFATTRFSTAIQYYIRDCIKACEDIGIDSRLSIEKSDIHRTNGYEWLKSLDEFKPDIVFVIGHFRWEYPCIPENVVFICWIQDQLPNIMSKESPAKLKELDYLLNVHFTAKEIFEIGYPRDKMIEAPVYANHNIYKFYSITEEEKRKFCADICVFSNIGTPHLGIRNVCKLFSSNPLYDEIEMALYSAYEEMYQMVYSGNMIYDLKDYVNLISKCFNKHGLLIDDKSIVGLSSHFRIEVAFRIYRSVIIEWLHEKGYNMKLWGREWLEHPTLKSYAQGTAKNGETLSKVINASKIVIGINPATTTHPRVFETILSNSLYISPHIPGPYDWADIKRLMVEDEEIVFFYNKQDLYKKIDFYLNNEEKRIEIIKNGKKKILSKLNFVSMMQSTINEISIRLQRQN